VATARTWLRLKPCQPLAKARQAVPAALHGLGREVALGVQAIALAHGFLQVFGAVDLAVIERPISRRKLLEPRSTAARRVPFCMLLVL
jgi:hypothetical protein